MQAALRFKPIAIPVGQRKARIEIIPLIDIMFFLLASFMLVSLGMVRLQGMQMTLPSKTPPIRCGDCKPTLHEAQILADGTLVTGSGTERAVTAVEAFLATVAKAHQDPDLRPHLRVFLNADKDAAHGAVIGLLDAVKALGVERVTFSLRPRSLPPVAR